ncbi:hypothetical protein BD779DRAFT_1610380 [Infundibulicybe gibba]|nr:hypothetical protein BD779DRAFT_1610380 [Infundibulicybe gibba]
MSQPASSPKPTTPTKMSPGRLAKKVKRRIHDWFHRDHHHYHHHVLFPKHDRQTSDASTSTVSTTTPFSPLHFCVIPSLSTIRTLSPRLVIPLSANPIPIALTHCVHGPYRRDLYRNGIFFHFIDTHRGGNIINGGRVTQAGLTPTDSQSEAYGEQGSVTPSALQSSFDSSTAHAEQDVPDPFLIDDEMSEEGSEETPVATVSEPQHSIVPVHEIPLTVPSPSPGAPLSPTFPNMNKDVPPPPQSDSDHDDVAAPDLYLPGLVLPTMFLPIPNTDPLTTLLTKYIYPPDKRPARDITGEWQHSDFHTLVMTNSWRALARMARDRIVTSDPEDVGLVLGLWYLRLSCLARLRLFNQTSAECTNLFSVLNAIEPSTARQWVFERILPFELEVMQARLNYWAGDHMGYLDGLTALLNKCKAKARLAGSDIVAVSMWKERGARLCLIIASQMVEMKEFTAAAKLLTPLCRQGDAATASALHSSIGRVYLQGGDVGMARKHFQEALTNASAEQRNMDTALLASAAGEWQQATEILRDMLGNNAGNFVAVNNLAVALLGQGKLKDGIEVLETALQSSPSSVVVAEPFLFNLATLYELRSATAIDKKRDLLVEVAKWSGDGLKASCLKMPSN